MSVTKNSNQNQLQQVEMQLRHVYIHNTCNTTGQLWMRVASFYELLKISLALLVKTLAYTTGTTSKHQRAMWPELYPKSIVFPCIVAWHMSVLLLAQCLRLRCRMLRRYQKRSKKTHFFFEFWNFLTTECNGQETHVFHVCWHGLISEPIEIRAWHVAFDCLTSA